DLRVHPEDAEVLVRNPLESLADFLRRQLVPVLSEGRRLVERDLALLFAAVRTSLPLLRLPRGLLRDEADLRHVAAELLDLLHLRDRKSTRLNSSHVAISYAVFCSKKKIPY